MKPYFMEEHMEKEILLRIHQARVNFTYVEEDIATYFTSGKQALSIHDLAKELSISSSSITRFCKKIGLNNYKELMYLYDKHLHDGTPSISNISLDLQSEYFHIFHLVDQDFDVEAMHSVCDYIYKHRVINIFAFGLSATAAQDFKFRFSRLGKFIEVIHDKDAISMSARVLQENDLVFIFTLRGNVYLEDLAMELKRKGVIVVSILGNKKSRLVTLSDICLYTSSLAGEESTGMISGQIPILIMIDMLYYSFVRTYNDALTCWASTEEVFKNGNPM